MIKRLYVHNFRCLENFELPVASKPSTLLIGGNGAGKSTVGHALGMLRSVARGATRIRDLVKPKDFARGRSDSPMRLELDVELGRSVYQYVLAFELPAGFSELRVLEERFVVDGAPVFTRKNAQVFLGPGPGARFLIDWHLVGLPIVQETGEADPLAIFKRWLSRMLVLAPEPRRMLSESSGASLEPDRAVANVGEWFTGLVASSPAAYATIASYLKDVMPDFTSITNPLTGSETRNLIVNFQRDSATLALPFGDLSDGEKCFFVGALVLAANEAYGPLFCFWDEPDAHLSMWEVHHFVMALRGRFERGGQFVMSSHAAEAIRAFSDENTFVASRRTHLEPTQLRSLASIERGPGDLIDVVLRGELAE